MHLGGTVARNGGPSPAPGGAVLSCYRARYRARPYRQHRRHRHPDGTGRRSAGSSAHQGRRQGRRGGGSRRVGGRPALLRHRSPVRQGPVRAAAGRGARGPAPRRAHHLHQGRFPARPGEAPAHRAGRRGRDLRLLARRGAALPGGELRAAAHRPRRHRPHPRPGLGAGRSGGRPAARHRQPLPGGDGGRLSGPGGAARRRHGGRDRAGHEPVADAAGVRARRRLRLLHAGRPLHAAGPDRAA